MSRGITFPFSAWASVLGFAHMAMGAEAPARVPIAAPSGFAAEATQVSTNALSSDLLLGLESAPTVEFLESRIPELPLEAPAAALAAGTQQGTDVLGSSPVVPPRAGGAGSAAWDVPPAFRWGLFTAHPRMGYGLTYGTGLRGQFGGQAASLMQTVSPGLRLDVGRYWHVDYSPTALFYESDAFRDTVNQSVSLSGLMPGPVWTFSVGGAFSLQDNPLVETGRQTEQTSFSTQAGASRPLTERLSLNLGLSQSYRDASGFNEVMSLGNQNSLDYRFREHLSGGLVVGFGYDQVDPGTDMVSERVQGRFQGQLGERFRYNAQAGFELRQFQSGDAGSLVSPIYSGGLSYSATETTDLALSFQQSVSPSFFNDQLNQSTALSASVSQQVLEKLRLSVSGAYRWNERSSTVNTSQQQGTDELVSVQVSLGTRFLKRGSMSVFWSWSDNTSTQRGLGFSSEQVGLNVSYGF